MAHDGAVWPAADSPNGERIGTASWDGTTEVVRWASPGVKAKCQNLELEPTTAKPAPPKLARGSAGAQVQLVQLIQMKTPFPAVKQSAQLSGYNGDIITLYWSYQ